MLGLSLDYTTSESSLKLLLHLVDPAQALNVPVVPLGALLAAVYPLAFRSPYFLSWLYPLITAQDTMHPELMEKFVLNNLSNSIAYNANEVECPLDLKEAISSICFAAPRCADLPALIQVQMLFVGKYGKEFVLAATELMAECGVNRQLIELLYVRAPAPDVKLKLLKDIAEELELDWDPTASESELLKPHADLLNGPTQFVSGTKVPLPEEKNDDDDDVQYSASAQVPVEQSDLDAGFDTSDFLEVPKASRRSSGIPSNLLQHKHQNRFRMSDKLMHQN